MPTLESLRRQIDTATDLQSVVSTMKTLAAVSIRQYEQAADALADYNRTVDLGFQILLRGDVRRFEDVPVQGNVAVIIFGSDQGMCGQFNERIVEFAVDHHRQDHTQVPTSVLVVGARVTAALAEAGWDADETFHVPTSVSEITDLVEEMIPRLEFGQREYGITSMQIYFNRRSASAAFIPRHRQLLPISQQRIAAWRNEPWKSRSLPIFSGDRRELISSLVRQYLLVSLYRACTESLASENASRIAAMQAAEKNIDERLDDLQGAFNSLRQSTITEELLDVITGFEALTGHRS